VSLLTSRLSRRGAASIYALFATVVWTVDVRQIGQTLAAFGLPGLVLFLAIEGIGDVMHGVATRFCLSGEQRRVPLRSLVFIRFTVRAYNFLTPTSGVASEVVKGTLLQRYCSGHDAASAVLIDKFTFGVSQFGMAFVGSALVLTWVDIPYTVRVVFWVASGLLCLAFTAFFLVMQQGWLTTSLRWLITTVAGRTFGEKFSLNILELDERLRHYYRGHTGDLFVSILCHAVGFATDIILVWLFLYLTFEVNSWIKAGAIWALSTWCDVMVFVVRAGLGVQEVSRALIFRSVGLAWPYGVSYSIVLRIAQVFWSLGGLGMHSLELASTPPPRRLLSDVE
jgi:uncharacterized protein (TIRG00374 family)